MKKNFVESIDISDYNYHLSDDRIAKYPLAERDQSKLLCYRNGNIQSKNFYELPEQLPSGCLVIFNNTRVIHARILFKKPTGATIEVFCLSPYEPKEYAVSFAQTKATVWTCMVGNAKRWKQEGLTLEIPVDGEVLILVAKKTAVHNQEYEVEFSWNNPDYTFSDILERAGNLPIPHYLNRPTEESDEQTYQTVYSQVEGSVAAPTAGLHFTNDVMESIKEKNIILSEVTLHVGAGTFRPVKEDKIGDHEMHTELISVQRDTIEKMLRNENELVAIGTTSLRTIESLYYLGVKILRRGIAPFDNLIVEQWEPYDSENNIFTPKESLAGILEYMEEKKLSVLVASTKIIIAPGYEFKFVDGLLTNFHQPQSTLLLLVSAFVGKDWMRIYDFAMHNNYRFLSYGDSSLLWKKTK